MDSRALLVSRRGKDFRAADSLHRWDDRRARAADGIRVLNTKGLPNAEPRMTRGVGLVSALLIAKSRPRLIRSSSTLQDSRDMSATCYECALRECGLFKPITPEELSVINDILRERVSRPAGAEIVRAGDGSPVYTLYCGWAFRYKTLPD